MDKNFKINKDFNSNLISELNKRFDKIKLGGGKNKIKKHQEKGKLTARDRIDYLLDKKNNVIRVGGVKFTIKNGVIYDSKQLLENVKNMVEIAKEKEGFVISQPGN